MAPPTRVFVIANSTLDARKLADVFNSPDFRVVDTSAASGAERLDSAPVDVFVVRLTGPVSLPVGVPVLWLDSPAYSRQDPDRTHAFLENAMPDQIRAAAHALAAGLRFAPIHVSQNHLEDDSTFQEALTDRELEVLNLVAEGLSNPEIARQLNLSRNTVKFHLSSIMGKLGASSRTEAVTEGLRRGLIII